MTDQQQRFAAAAIKCLDTPFRLHGRSSRFGLDCVGLVIVCLAAVSKEIPHLPDYGLRNIRLNGLSKTARKAGFVPATGGVQTGDLLLVRPGPAQTHFLIASGASAFVHADAGLRRVVQIPGPLRWPIIRHFRLSKEP